MNYMQLDRAKFERAFLETGHRGVTAALSHLALYSFFLIFIEPRQAGTWKYVGLAGMIASVVSRSSLRFSAIRRSKLGEVIAPRLFQNIFRSSSFLMGFCWSLSFVASFWQFGLSMPTMAIYVVILGFAPASIGICAFDPVVSGAFILSSAVPVVIACAFAKMPGAPTVELSAFYLAHIFYSFTVVRRTKIVFYDNIQSQLEVENQKRQLEGILDAVPGYVAWIDENGISLGCNRLFANALNRNGAEVKGKSLSDLIGQESQVATLMEEFRRGNSEETVHEVRSAMSGHSRWYILALRKFLTPTGANTVAVAVDISNEKRVQEELSAEKSRVTQSERLSLIGAMAGGVAHEINNPLAIISGRLEKIRELDEAHELEPGQAAQLATKAMQTVDRIARIVRGLRLMARGETSDARSIYNAVDLCRDVMELAASRARQVEAKIEFDCADERLEVLCQPTQISQIVLNLIQNSLDAIESEPERWVKIRLLKRGQLVDISVTDSGKTASIQNPEKVFEPFFTTKAAGEGCGLGLSISQTLARRYGGDLRLDVTSLHTCFHLIISNDLIDGEVVPLHSEKNSKSALFKRDSAVA